VVHAFPTYGEAVGMPWPGRAQRPAAQADGAGGEPGADRKSRQAPGSGLAPKTGGGAAADVSGDAGTAAATGAGPGTAPGVSAVAGPAATAGGDTPAVPPGQTLPGQGQPPGALPSRKPPAGPDRVSTQPSHNT
jgi:hypothetical protein